MPTRLNGVVPPARQGHLVGTVFGFFSEQEMPIVVELYDRAAKPRGYAFPVQEAAARIPGIKWDRSVKSYVGYSDAIEAFAAELNRQKLATLIERRSFDLPIESSPKHNADTLREYQKTGVSFLIRHAGEGALLCDDVGVGKTCQAITSGLELGARKLVILCPAIAKGVWAAELKKWSSYQAKALKGTKPNGESFDSLLPQALIVNYDIAHAWANRLIAYRPDMLILDEIHYLMSDRSRRSVACKAIAEAAQHRIGLSATPMTTRPKDLWNPIDTISPGRFGRAWTFYRRYANAHKAAINAGERGTIEVWDLNGSSNADELSARLKYFMIRRTKSEILTELPARIRQTIDLDVGANFISPIWEMTDRKDRNAVRRALDLAASGKIIHAVEMARSLRDQGHRVLLFAHLKRDVYRLAKSLGVTAAAVTGDESPANRKKIIDSKPDFLAATIDSVGVSIDLTYYDTVIFVALDWVPSKLLQAEGRAHRFGQSLPVTIYYLVARGSADDFIKRTVLDRLNLYDQILGDTEASKLRSEIDSLNTISEEDLLKQMRESILNGDQYVQA